MKILLSHMGHQSTHIYFNAIPVDRQFFADYNTKKSIKLTLWQVWKHSTLKLLYTK